MGVLGIWSDKNNITEHISSAYSWFMQLYDLITFIFSLLFPLLFKDAFGMELVYYAAPPCRPWKIKEPHACKGQRWFKILDLNLSSKSVTAKPRKHIPSSSRRMELTTQDFYIRKNVEI